MPTVKPASNFPEPDPLQSISVRQKIPKGSVETPPSTQPPNPQDPTHISRQTQEQQAIQRAITQLPEIREDRINRLREAIQSGEYRVHSADLADKIIQDILLHLPPT